MRQLHCVPVSLFPPMPPPLFPYPIPRFPFPSSLLTWKVRTEIRKDFLRVTANRSQFSGGTGYFETIQTTDLF